MQIQGPGPLSGPERISGPESGKRRVPRPDPVGSGGDRVELSDAARYMEKLRKLPDIRPGKVEEARAKIEDPGYDTDEKLRVSLRRMIQDLEDLGLEPRDGEIGMDQT